MRTRFSLLIAGFSLVGCAPSLSLLERYQLDHPKLPFSVDSIEIKDDRTGVGKTISSFEPSDGSTTLWTEPVRTPGFDSLLRDQVRRAGALGRKSLLVCITIDKAAVSEASTKYRFPNGVTQLVRARFNPKVTAYIPNMGHIYCESSMDGWMD